MQGSRQFKDFEDYLVPPTKFASLKQASELPLAVATDCDQYLHERLTLLETQLVTVNRMALANDLPEAIITESGLKITPLDAAVPDTAQALIDQTAMILPHVKITASASRRASATWATPSSTSRRATPPMTG